MPDAFFLSDSSAPDLGRFSTTEEKLAAVQDYLFLLLENLRWALRNLSPENFNQTELGDWIGKTVKAETVISETVITNELYSGYGAVADLTVDRLRTDWARARRYLAGDTSPLDYLRIHDEVLEFVTETTDGTRVRQLTADGRAFWWTDASMTQMTSRRETAWPVTVYEYEEELKAALRFDDVERGGQTVKVPVLRLGAGDGDGKNYAELYKDTEGLRIRYRDRLGGSLGMDCGADGYTDLYGLRKTACLDLSGWDGGSFSETLEGGLAEGYAVAFDPGGRPVSITDESGHEMEIRWESE